MLSYTEYKNEEVLLEATILGRLTKDLFGAIKDKYDDAKLQVELIKTLKAGIRKIFDKARAEIKKQTKITQLNKVFNEYDNLILDYMRALSIPVRENKEIDALLAMNEGIFKSMMKKLSNALNKKFGIDPLDKKSAGRYKEMEKARKEELEKINKKYDNLDKQQKMHLEILDKREKQILDVIDNLNKEDLIEFAKTLKKLKEDPESAQQLTDNISKSAKDQAAKDVDDKNDSKKKNDDDDDDDKTQGTDTANALSQKAKTITEGLSPKIKSIVLDNLNQSLNEQHNVLSYREWNI